MNLCGCGCGKEVSKEGRKFLQGHNVRLQIPWNKGRKWSDEILLKLRKPHPNMVGNNNPSKRDDVRQKISVSVKERWQNPEYRKFMAEMELRPDVKEKKCLGGKIGICRVQYSGKSNPNWGKKIDPEIVKKMVATRRKNGSYKAWNKGKTDIFSEETKQSISEKIKKLWKDPEYRKQMLTNHKDYSGENNPFYGKTHSEDARQKISKANKGRKFSDEIRQKLSKVHKGLLVKERNPAWLGGISREPYCFEFDRWLKEQIKERDSFKCKNPDCWQNSIKLCVHHIDYNKKNCSANNLITLCNSCNCRANTSRSYWKKLYTNIMENNYYGKNYIQI